MRLRRRSPRPSADSGGKLDRSILAAKDPWAKSVRGSVVQEYSDKGPLLLALGSATASRPTRKWLREISELLDDRGEALVRHLLEAAIAVGAKEIGRTVWEGRTYVQTLWLSDPSATLVRGCLWSTTQVKTHDWVPTVAGSLFERAMAEEEIKVGNAAAFALGESTQPESIAILSRLAARVKDRRFLKGIERALERAAEIRGMSRSQLRESLVPTLDLEPTGTFEAVVGDFTARIAVEPPGAVRTTWADGSGRTLKSAPAAVREAHAAELSALKARSAEIRKELAVQRIRLETLLADDRTWDFEEWHRHYLEHPLVQSLTRRLIWRFEEVVAIPLENDGYLARSGETIAPPTGGEVRLWHPIAEPPDSVAAWRDLLRQRELVQPFKQAFREVYYVAPAEEETDTYSNRFAAHILRYPQTYALMKQRGWGIVALGPYDNDGGRQWRDFDEQGIRAEFWMEHADDDWNAYSNLASIASTDQVRFYRGGDPEPLPVLDVPPLVFSEAMRDVDLFVGVTSVAADPEWLDHGPERYHAYWRDMSFRELSQTAEMRREALEQLLPSLRIADRCTLTDRYLVVSGKLRTYRIHLGSGNVLMEPNDRYLCIVASRGKSPGRVYLPFPEDERFSVILSKAFLLADDDRITDETILAQMR